jgi:hypothetical protein
MYDMKNLEKFKTLQVHAPEAMKAFLAFDTAAWSDGAHASGAEIAETVLAAAALRAGSAVTHGTHTMK